MPNLDWNVILTGLLYAALTGIFNLVFANKSQINEWAEANPRLAALLKVTRAVGLDPQHIWAALALFVKGRLPKVQTEPLEPAPKSRRVPPLVMLMLCLLVASGCSPAQWQHQAEVADRVAVVSNTTVLPMIQHAYDTGGMAVIALQPDRESAAAALAEYKKRWEPVWAGYVALKIAHDAWQDTIAAQGDPLPSAVAARNAFCELRAAAVAVKVQLPDFPIMRCQ